MEDWALFLAASEAPAVDEKPKNANGRSNDNPLQKSLFAA
jgi:hypothetical protein